MLPEKNPQTKPYHREYQRPLEDDSEEFKHLRIDDDNDDAGAHETHISSDEGETDQSNDGSPTIVRPSSLDAFSAKNAQVRYLGFKCAYRIS